MTDCYRAVNGTISLFTDAVACTAYTSSNGFTPCCFGGDVCLEDNICYLATPAQGSTGYFMALCSDPNYADSSCTTYCTDLNKGDIVYNTTTGLWSCCGQQADGTISCADPTTESFSAPAPAVLQAEASSLTAATTSSSSASTSASPSTSSTASSTSATSTSSTLTSTATTSSPSSTTTAQPAAATSTSGLSTGAKAGIGIGVAVAVLAILGLLLWALKSRRTMRNLQQERQQEPQTAAPQYYGNDQKPPMAFEDKPGYRPELPTQPPATEMPAQDPRWGMQTPANIHELSTR